MAISKRLRFEVLRRDNHSCRYCGRSAPDVTLHVDHVVPQALGGADEPSNLATACAHCNGGKTSSAPDQRIVTEVDVTAAKWSAAMVQAADEMRRVSAGRAETHDAVFNAFPSYYRNRIPSDYSDTINQFIDAGLPVDVMVEMARLASEKYGVTQHWKYFCGCCWTKIRQMQERARAIADSGDLPARAAAALVTVWTDDDLNIYVSSSESFARSAAIPADSWESAHCRHREWGQGSCDDPICRVARAETLSWMAFWTCRDNDKAEAVMDAADELELMH